MAKESSVNIEFRTNQPSGIIRSVADHFNVEVTTDCDEYIVTLPSEIGQVKISGVDFFDGHGLMCFQGVLNRDLYFKFAENQKQPLRFLFCSEGTVMHSINDQSIQYQLDAFKSSITTALINTQQVFKFPSALKLSIANLVIQREDFIEKVACNLETLPDKLANIFRDTESANTFLYEGYYSIATSECIKNILSNADSGLVRMTYLESKAMELLTYQLKQYQDDQRPSQKQVLLRKFDVDKIMEAREILKQDLKNAPTIKELARAVGINENKLKQGFKRIFETTINQFLRDERMELSKFLLLEDDRSIQEVAETIGYKSRGYFSRRFEEKFGMLPKDYVKNLRSTNRLN